VFEGNGMQVKGATGAGGCAAAGGEGQRGDRGLQAEPVDVARRVPRPLAEALAVVNNSPVTGFINQALARSTGSGDAGVDLRLALPVRELARSQVQGTVTLAGNDVQITPDTPMLSRARGTVLFSEKGFQVVGAQARALGGDLRLEGGTRPAVAGEPAVVQLRAQGNVTAEGLRQARELGFVARLARDFSGSTSYQLALGFRRGQPEVLLTSNLQGHGAQPAGAAGQGRRRGAAPALRTGADARVAGAARRRRGCRTRCRWTWAACCSVSYLRELGRGRAARCCAAPSPSAWRRRERGLPEKA
jgi:uncharacterized protein YhdP